MRIPQCGHCVTPRYPQRGLALYRLPDWICYVLGTGSFVSCKALNSLRSQTDRRHEWTFSWLQDALTVVHFSVVHPAAAIHVHAAARAEGSAAAVRDQAKRAQCKNSDSSGHAFVLLWADTFGRLGKQAMALLINLPECAFGRWCYLQGGYFCCRWFT